MVKRNIPISRIGVKGRIPPLVNKGSYILDFGFSVCY